MLPVVFGRAPARVDILSTIVELREAKGILGAGFGGGFGVVGGGEGFGGVEDIEDDFVDESFAEVMGGADATAGFCGGA